MSNETQTAVVVNPAKQPVQMGNRGIVLTDMDGLVRFATAVSKTSLAPKGLESAESIAVAIQMGLEVGLTPMAALQNIAVINGRPTIWGDAQLAVCRATGELEAFEEWYESGGKRTGRNPQIFGDDAMAVCSVKRRGYPAIESAFSVADAKRAGLWSKQGPWSQYPARMLRFRARSFALRDQFGDALKGMLTTEEGQDIDATWHVSGSRPMNSSGNVVGTPTIDAPTIRLIDQGEGTDFGPVTQKTETKKAEDKSDLAPHAKLAAILTKEGISVDSFMQWAQDAGQYVGPTPGGIDELDSTWLARWMKNEKVFGRQVEIMKGGAK